MEKTLNGLLNNLLEFKEIGVSNNEVVIICMYDGIDKLNNDEANDKNMLKFFWEFDQMFGNFYFFQFFSIGMIDEKENKMVTKFK